MEGMRARGERDTQRDRERDRALERDKAWITPPSPPLPTTVHPMQIHTRLAR